MRVPSISTYVNSTYRLGNLTSDLQNANEIVTTQKRINEISDDPLGLTQVLSLKNTLGNFDQIERNITMGKSWLESGETAMDNVNTLLASLKAEVIRLSSDSMSANERLDAVETVENTIRQIVTLGNTQVNGNYIFGGNKTDIPPLIYNADDDPPSIFYQGNNSPFEIRTDRNSTVQVGRDGEATFWDDTININSSNNTIVFEEDNGHGSASEKIIEATVPDGTYTKANLEIAMQNALNNASADKGYGVVYNVTYDEETRKYSIENDGSHNGYIRTEFMWETGGDAYVKNIGSSSGLNPDDISLNLINKQALTLGTLESSTGKPFKLTWNKSQSVWEIENNPGYILPSTLEGTSESVDIDFNEDGVADISIAFDQPVDDNAFVQFDIIPQKGDHGLADEIGFNEENMILAPPTSDVPAVFITDIVINTAGNNTIIFEEINSTGGSAVLTANFNTSGADVTYTDMDSLAQAIETEMEAESAASGNSIDYEVSYNPDTSRFNIRENGSNLNELNIQWSNSTAAAQTLGYYLLDDSVTYPKTGITIDTSNNILDFSESTGGAFTTLQAVIPSGTYNDLSDFASAVEAAMEASSGLSVNYDVTYNQVTEQFEIQGSGGTGLTDFNLLWASGTGTRWSVGETLGYDISADDTGAGLGPYAGDTSPMLMSLYSALIDNTNNMLDFEETNTAGVTTTLQAQIPIKTYTSVRELEKALESALNKSSFESGNYVYYDVAYNEAGNFFEIQQTSGTTLTSFSLLWDTGINSSKSIGDIMGYDTSADNVGGGILTPYSSSSGSAPVWISFDSTNNAIDFTETNIDGTVSQEMEIEIPAGDYRDLDDVATAIQTELRDQSPNNVDYIVSYDSSNGFMIKGSSSDIKGFDLLWQSGGNADRSAAGKLGFDPGQDQSISFAESDQDVVNITIDASNNKIDFTEVVAQSKGKTISGLTASVKEKVYTSYTQLALEIEKALEKESGENGKQVNYSAAWDEVTRKFTIKEEGTRLDEFHLQWQTGDNAPVSQGGTGQSIGSIIGFYYKSDDIETSLMSTRNADVGIFNTLLDLKSYLADNDRYGIERIIGRLELNFENMTSRIANTGMKYVRLETRQEIVKEVGLSLSERKSMIEDADIIQSVMDLQAIQTAYQAALASTSKILNLSLVDYLR